MVLPRFSKDNRLPLSGRGGSLGCEKGTYVGYGFYFRICIKSFLQGLPVHRGLHLTSQGSCVVIKLCFILISLLMEPGWNLLRCRREKLKWQQTDTWNIGFGIGAFKRTDYCPCGVFPRNCQEFADPDNVGSFTGF